VTGQLLLAASAQCCCELFSNGVMIRCHLGRVFFAFHSNKDSHKPTRSANCRVLRFLWSSFHCMPAQPHWPVGGLFSSSASHLSPSSPWQCPLLTLQACSSRRCPGCRIKACIRPGTTDSGSCLGSNAINLSEALDKVCMKRLRCHYHVMKAQPHAAMLGI